MKTSSDGNSAVVTALVFVFGMLLGAGISGYLISSQDLKTLYQLPKDKWMCWISLYYGKMEQPECVVFKRKDIDLGGFGHRRRDDDFPKGAPILTN